jgi:CheY-like chemotaxis protein
MGRIAGDLEVLGITSLFQAITGGLRLGRLTVTRDAESKTILVGPGGLRILKGTRRASPLGEILLRTRKITRAQLALILQELPASKLPLGEYVTRKGWVTRDKIETALREQAADEIYDLFTWTAGRFEFEEVPGDSEVEGDGLLSTVVLDQSVMYLALEAARRMDQLDRIREVIPGDRLVPVALEIPLSGREDGLDRDSLVEILPFVDGKRSVAQIIEASLYPKFTVLVTLFALAQRGSAKIRDVGASDGPETVLLRRAPGGGTGTDAATVVLMGDNVQARVTIALYLGHLGYAVIECPTSEDLRYVLKRAPAGVVLLDLDLTSPERLDKCRRIVAQAGAPVLLMTTLDSEASVANAFASGARHVLLKPVNSELLVERLREVLDPESVPAGD